MFVEGSVYDDGTNKKAVLYFQTSSDKSYVAGLEQKVT